MAHEGDKKGDDKDGDKGAAGDDDKGKNGAFTEEQLKAIDARTNAAVSNQLSRFRTSFEKDITESIGTAMSPLSEQLKTIGEAQASKGEDKGKKDSAKGDRDLELKKANTRIADLERKNKEAEDRASSTETKRLAGEEKVALQKALRTAGVDDEHRVRAAVAVLFNVDKRVGRNDDNDIVFKVQRTGYVDELTLDEGVAEWVKTDEGKTFMPPRGVAGSGNKGSQRAGKPLNTKEEKIAAARRELAAASGVPYAE